MNGFEMRAFAEKAWGNYQTRYFSRHFNGTLSFTDDSSGWKLVFCDGVLTGVDPCEADFRGDVWVAPTNEQWEKLLEKCPSPFYQGILMASFNHGVRISEDPLSKAYFPLVTHLVRLMRLYANGGEF